MNQGIANGMFSHLMGFKHRQAFVQEYYRDDPSKVIDLSQSELLNYARRHAENGDNLNERIKTRRSDEVSVKLGVAGGPTEIFVGVSLASWQGSLVHREGRHGHTSRQSQGELGEE